MEVEELKVLQDKIAKAKEKKARLQGSIDAILESWEKKYGFKTIEEAQAHLEKLDKKIDGLQVKQKGLESELNEIVDWDSL